jgi:hypothetical protein
MKKWEYVCVSISSGAEKTTLKLNEYGKDGWELVSVHGDWHYFKRELVQ